MSNFIQEFEEEDIEQFDGDHDASCINPTVTTSKKKRNLPGNPGTYAWKSNTKYFFFFFEN